MSAGALAMAIVVGSPSDVLMAGQAQTVATPTYTPPKTPWGDPDLQGIYDFNSYVPMERPVELAGKTTFTDAELDAWMKKRQTDQLVNEDWHVRIRWVRDHRTALIIDPPDGKIPLSADGVKRFTALEEYRRLHQQAYETPAEIGSYERCISRVIPRMFQRYNNGTQLVQSPGYVTIVYEQLDTRIIPLDGRPPLDPHVRQWNGDSRGHWEGNTLVVETTNFSDKQTGWPPMRDQGGQSDQLGHAGVPRENLKITERYTPVSATRLEYFVTNDDPTWFSSPWTFMLPWEKYETYQIYEYACSEGNIAVENALRGARVNDINGKPYQPPAEVGRWDADLETQHRSDRVAPSAPTHVR